VCGRCAWIDSAFGKDNTCTRLQMMIQTLKKENLGDANAGHLEDDQEVAAQAGTTLRRYLDSSNKKNITTFVVH
jgi:hypothetical protein